MKTFLKKFISFKKHLTLEEVRAKGLYYYVYTEDESVYKYEIKGKGETLVEDGVKLCENVHWCHWYAKGVYKYYIESKDCWTLIENGDKLCENVFRCYWYAKGVYKYYIESKDCWTLIENGDKLCENMYECRWHSKGAYEYKQNRNSDFVKVGF